MPTEDKQRDGWELEVWFDRRAPHLGMKRSSWSHEREALPGHEMCRYVPGFLLDERAAEIERLRDAVAVIETLEALGYRIQPATTSPPDQGAIQVSISLEGAKSFASDSPGWGAIGQQEITEAVLAALAERGITPPFQPHPKGERVAGGSDS